MGSDWYCKDYLTYRYSHCTFCIYLVYKLNFELRTCNYASKNYFHKNLNFKFIYSIAMISAKKSNSDLVQILVLL